MKKAVSIILSLVFVFALVAGCSASPGPGMMWHGTSAPPSAGGAAPAFSQGEPWIAGEEWRYAPIDETDEFAIASESPFKDARTSPLSTFSASVNTASYSIMRRQIMQGMEPFGLRIEEMINYFDYNYPAPLPGNEHPFSIITEVSQCP